MSGALRQMVTCHWTARRIQRDLDADPAAPMTPGEVTRQHPLLHRALSLWSGRRPVDPAPVDRMRTVLDDLIDERQT